MDDEIFDEEGTDLSVMHQEWKKIQESRIKDGFVSGAVAGQNATIQDGFNSGFKQGMMASFLISQIKGILRGILAYSTCYEGHPITDDIVLDTERILEDILKMETDKIAEDFLEMQIKTDRICTDDVHFNELSTMTLDSTKQDNASMDTDLEPKEVEISENIGCSYETKPSINTSVEMTLNDAKKLLLLCPEINQVVHQCKDVLRRLRWSHNVLDLLL